MQLQVCMRRNKQFVCACRIDRKFFNKFYFQLLLQFPQSTVALCPIRILALYVLAYTLCEGLSGVVLKCA